AEDSIAMGTGRVCIATKSHKNISEKIHVEVHGEYFEVHVQEIYTWSVNISDNSLDTSSNIDVNEVINAADAANSVEDNSIDDLKDLNENLNNMDHDFKDDKEPMKNPDKPPGFEHFKRSPAYSSKCSTFFARHHKKDIKGVLLIHELNRIIEVGNALGYDVRGCRKSLNRMINVRHHENRIKLLQDLDNLDNLEARDNFDNLEDSQINFSPLVHSTGLCPSDRDLFETRVSLEKVKIAVWDCGSNKASGLDGMMPQGANSSFFTLISKVSNPIYIKDFHLISLIDIHYKIIAKILANRLSKVIDKIVSKEQSAFIVGRKILDGPLILSEVIDWFKKIKKKMLIFKVDFKKAFDSVSWKYLDFVLLSIGFGSKWRS
ncbi:RNA-directed DNA polymerase, eukaryota, reverse transcriptase zinc-binding domain protein, partial [Tanacetum coccineum]